MENKNPLISIIIPYFNTDFDKFENCINSVLSQTYKNIEVLIIDDYSTMEYAKYLDQISNRDSRIKVKHNKDHVNVSIVRNNGISICKGEYVLFVDSDDMINYYTLEKMYCMIKKNNADFVIGGMTVITDYGDADIKVGPTDKVIFYNDKFCAIEDMITSKNFGSSPCCRLASKKTWLKNSHVFECEKGYPFVEKRLHEDLGCMWRVLLGCEKICFLEGNYYYYYKGDHSSIHTKKISVKFCEDFLWALKYRGDGLLKYENMQSAVAFSYLIYCPNIYCYARKIEKIYRKKLLLETKKLFKENYIVGKNYGFLSKRLRLFRVSPFAYYVLEKFKNLRIKSVY